MACEFALLFVQRFATDAAVVRVVVVEFVVEEGLRVVTEQKSAKTNKLKCCCKQKRPLGHDTYRW